MEIRQKPESLAASLEMSASDTSVRPSRDVVVWQRHQVRTLLDTEAEKERLERLYQAKLLRQAKLEPPKASPRHSPRVLPREALASKPVTERLPATDPSPTERLKPHSRLAEIKTLRTQQQLQEEALVETRLREVQRRLEHSNELHSAVLQTRAQSAAQKRRRAGSLAPRRDEEQDRLLAYVQKQQSVSPRKKQETKERWRQEREEKARKAACNRQAQRQALVAWVKSLEAQQVATETAVEARLTVQRDAQLNRQEQLREKAEECQVKRRRLQRLQFTRQTDLLDQWTALDRRVDSLKQQRALSVERYRGRLRCNMLTKERTYEVLSVVARSPKSKKAQELLKALDTVD